MPAEIKGPDRGSSLEHLAQGGLELRGEPLKQLRGNLLRAHAGILPIREIRFFLLAGAAERNAHCFVSGVLWHCSGCTAQSGGSVLLGWRWAHPQSNNTYRMGRRFTGRSLN